MGRKLKYLFIFLGVLLILNLVYGQQAINGSRYILGYWDASQARWTKPFMVSASQPATCAVGEVMFDSDATAGQNLYLCTATDTWTQVTGGGGWGDMTKAVYDTDDDGTVDLSCCRSRLNKQAAALADGDAVVWNTSTPDGVRTTQPATATLSLFVGLPDGAIAASAYGLAQAYGYKATGLVTNHTTQAVAAGDILIPVDAVDNLARSAASDGKSGFVFAGAALATATTPAATSLAVFIRAL